VSIDTSWILPILSIITTLVVALKTLTGKKSEVTENNATTRIKDLIAQVEGLQTANEALIKDRDEKATNYLSLFEQNGLLRIQINELERQNKILAADNKTYIDRIGQLEGRVSALSDLFKLITGKEVPNTPIGGQPTTDLSN
jgi:cell division protein FtsL